jgi:predicted 3-demethylubiquinone-9 3-methyltransferase (glyoxalase superfamily)
MQKITPFLWFDNQAEEAVQFYVSVFKNSEIIKIIRYGDDGPGPNGTVMTIGFMIESQEFAALNGGPQFRFSQAISFVVNCRTQEEVDEYWENLSAGGEKQPCGWLKDKFGVSWQVVPGILSEMLNDKDPVKAGRVMTAMLRMNKIDIQVLKQVYNGT